MESSNDPILNTLAPMLYLDPLKAMQHEKGRYILVGCVAVLFCDFIQSIPEDYTLFCTTKFGLNGLVFGVMRLSALLPWLIAIITNTSYFGSCATITQVLSTLFALNRTCTSFVFYSRVRALLWRQRYITFFFGVLWVLVVAAPVLLVAFRALVGVNVGPTRTCTTIVARGYFMLPIPILETTFDALVCVAVTFRLSHRNASELDQRPRHWRRWFSLNYRGRQVLSERFLRDSQFYFVLTACIKVPELIVLLVSQIHQGPLTVSPLNYALVYPDFVVVNILASKIYRNMKLGQPGLLSSRNATTVLGESAFWRPTGHNQKRPAPEVDLSSQKYHSYPPS